MRRERSQGAKAQKSMWSSLKRRVRKRASSVVKCLKPCRIGQLEASAPLRKVRNHAGRNSTDLRLSFQITCSNKADSHIPYWRDAKPHHALQRHLDLYDGERSMAPFSVKGHPCLLIDSVAAVGEKCQRRPRRHHESRFSKCGNDERCFRVTASDCYHRTGRVVNANLFLSVAFTLLSMNTIAKQRAI